MDKTIRSLLSELSASGYPVTDLAQLVHAKDRYPEAIPVLIQWLDSLEPEDVQRQKQDVEFAVRALAVAEARGSAGPTLVRLFRIASDPTGMGLRWVIGNTLEVAANDQIASDLISIATDKSYGRARQMIVLGLARLKSPRAERALIELLSDDDVNGHAVIALGKRRSQAAARAISRLLVHSNPWVRKEAKKALERIRPQSKDR